ncbi:MAG: NapC/NirT family cytochrome c [Candidatus Omnitrophica bacterium]|nr:NapC/NirT family cytochrome c [Candidatus Omnitrophota bacterium]
MNKRLFSENFYNRTSYLGALLAALMFILEIVLFAMDFFSGYSNGYLGLFTYMILPPILIIGLLLIPIGALQKHYQIKHGVLQNKKLPIFIIDLENQEHRNALGVFIVGTAIFLIMTAVGSYKAFNYTESVSFCGTTCHNVMKPEYTAYMGSAHARVKCVECHIGSGAGWYVHSKLSGARQVLKTILNNFSRPIPVPVRDLRPAKETCEECHWPGKSFSAIEQEHTYFPNDPGEAPRWKIRMLMHVSGGGNGSAGIHAHMFNNNTIYYVADDDQRQKISWVKSVNAAGVETIYTSKGSPYIKAAPSVDKIRKMDCIDCHSRPSHHFQAPVPLVDRAMAEGRINADIPLIKSKAVAALAKKYITEPEAVDAIRASLLKYYQEQQASYYAAHEKDVRAGIEAIIDIYQHNFFPEMGSRWDVYPDNIGHLISPGCFRCHDGEHRTPGGKDISRSCDRCHTIIEQGPPDKLQQNINGLPFEHPFVGNDSLEGTTCSDCHNGS